MFALVLAWTAYIEAARADAPLSVFFHNLGFFFSLHTFFDNFMGAYFVLFGLLKLANLRTFAAAYARYDFFAMRSRWYAYAYPFLELGLGYMFLFGINHRVANAVTLVLMTEKALSVAESLRKGSAPQCACLGGFFSLPISKVTLFEDVLMAVMAFVTLIFYT
jgi:hypothetical protein